MLRLVLMNLRIKNNFARILHRNKFNIVKTLKYQYLIKYNYTPAVSISNIRLFQIENRETLDTTAFAVVFYFSGIRKNPIVFEKILHGFCTAFLFCIVEFLHSLINLAGFFLFHFIHDVRIRLECSHNVFMT